VDPRVMSNAEPEFSGFPTSVGLANATSNTSDKDISRSGECGRSDAPVSTSDSIMRVMQRAHSSRVEELEDALLLGSSRKRILRD